HQYLIRRFDRLACPAGQAPSSRNRPSSRENIPPSARGSASGFLRISAFVNPALTSPVVALAVHQLWPLSPRLPLDPRGAASRRKSCPVLAVTGASRSSFTDTGGTSVAPGHLATTLTSLKGSSRAAGLNLRTTNCPSRSILSTS